MAAISLSASDDTSAFIHDFTGSNRHVLDYLLGEVLDGQPPEIQRFLLQTAILDRLNAPLCAAVLEGEEVAHRPPGSSAQQILEQLDRSNLFVTPLDNERGWYRYHRLFADLLRGQIRSGVFESQSLLPSERELCENYSVSRSTVRQAIQVLKEERLIRKERGVGTRIENSPVIEQNLLGFHNFDLQMIEQGHSATLEILTNEILSGGGRVQRMMDLPKTADIFKVVRLRLVDRKPVFIEKIYMRFKNKLDITF